MDTLSPAEIACPIRSLVRRYSNIEVMIDEVVDIKRDENLLVTKNRILRYDYLIMACGSNHAYFGKNEWEDFAPGINTLG